MADRILALNAGSSSVKLAIFNAVGGSPPRAIARGHLAQPEAGPVRVALEESAAHSGAERTFDRLEEALAWLAEEAEQNWGGGSLVAAGHRVVHGGRRFGSPQHVTSEVMGQLQELVPLAPLHQPQNLAPIRALQKARPALAQIACFDTAFHRGRAAIAKRFALPRVYEAKGIERYGFHGLSYEYIAGALASHAPALASGRVIVAHLGNGASLCGLSNGQSVDTTMSFTALDGLPMGTRCGALDPGVLLYLMREEGLTAATLEDLLYRRSGLLGVSGVSSDMRELLQSDDPRAAEAVELFCYRVAREIGALVAALGGLDGLVFTAGIGEHAPAIRSQICERSAWLGISLDAEANERGDPRISSNESRISVWVIPTDEELTIARQVCALLHGQSEKIGKSS